MPTLLLDSLCLLILAASSRNFRKIIFKLRNIKRNLNFPLKKGAYTYWFSKNFTCLRSFHSLRLLFFKKNYMPTFIREPTFIRYLRVPPMIGIAHATFSTFFIVNTPASLYILAFDRWGCSSSSSSRCLTFTNSIPEYVQNMIDSQRVITF